MTAQAPAAMTDDGRGLPAAPSAAAAAGFQGFCHYAALALREITGWELRALGAPADEWSMSPWNGLGGIRHAYCLTPSGQAVDVHGVFASEAAIRRFHAHEHDHDETLISVTVSAADLRDSDRTFLAPVYGEEYARTRKLIEGLRLPELAAAHAEANSPAAA